jgi:photosystem II stability/assembly factor-like uncharacterized protein
MGNFVVRGREAQTNRPQAAPAASAEVASPKSGLQDAAKAKKEAKSTDVERDKLSENVRPSQEATSTVSNSASSQTMTSMQATLAPVWKVGRHGLIKKIDSEGRWRKEKSGVTAHLYAIASPSADVGWAVGQAGTVLRTTDGGATWTQLSSPSAEDLVRVTATSDLAAMVVTRNGRTFTTSDGGNNWSSPDNK